MVSITCSAGIQVAVPGDEFLTFQELYPLEQIFWDNVVLIGDASHPTAPHRVRSPKKSTLDAAVLGKCMEKWGAETIPSALETSPAFAESGSNQARLSSS